MSPPKERPTVLVIGGGFAGVTIAASLDDVADVTLVEPKDTFVFNVAALRALVAPEWAPRIFMPYDNLLSHGRILRDSVSDFDGRVARLMSGAELTADYVVLATGSWYPFPAKAASVSAADDIARIQSTNVELATADRVLILGAGAVGLELAGEIAARWPEKHVILFDVSDDILPGGYRPELRTGIRRQLYELGIELVLGDPLVTQPRPEAGIFGRFTLGTQSGKQIDADIWFQAYGLRPVTNYLAGDLRALVDDNGYVKIDEFMNLPGHPDIYAVGDIAAGHVNGAGRANRQADAVAANIRAAITTEGQASPIAVAPPAIILPLGPEHGSGQVPSQDDLLSAERVAEVKGRDMMVELYQVKMRLKEPPAAS